MPVSVKPEGDKFRVVGEDGKPEANAAGTAVDGGGHSVEADALAQARAINARKGLRAELVEALGLGLPGFLTSSTPEEVDGLGVVIRTGDPVGPFGGITQVPVGVLELLPTAALARLGDQRHLFWVPLALEFAGKVEDVEAAAHRWVVRKSGDGYGVFKGSKKGGQHGTRAAAQKCADARNRMTKAGLPGDLPEDVMHKIVEAARLAELVTSASEGHHHAYQTGDEKTGPPIPADEHDEHTHDLPSGSGETAPAPGKTTEKTHTHRRDPAELGGDTGTVEDATVGAQPVGVGANQ